MNTMVEVRPGFWRVLHSRGQLLGYVERTARERDDAYAARRLSSTTRRPVPMGEFARLDDAIASFGS